MDTNEHSIADKNHKKSKRGSTNNKKRLHVFRDKQAKKGADWGGCTAEKLQTVIVLITELGGAVTFGTSRDQGAHSLTLLLNNERETMWYNGDADLDAELEDVTGELLSMA